MRPPGWIDSVLSLPMISCSYSNRACAGQVYFELMKYNLSLMKFSSNTLWFMDFFLFAKLSLSPAQILLEVSSASACLLKSCYITFFSKQFWTKTSQKMQNKIYLVVAYFLNQNSSFSKFCWLKLFLDPTFNIYWLVWMNIQIAIYCKCLLY